MTLVDTSIWLHHLRRTDARLVRLLNDGEVACHPCVLGELACGRFARSDEVLGLLERLPAVDAVSDREARAFIEAHELAGSGVGWVDVHLLAAARLSRITLLTADKALHRAAVRVGVA